MDAIITGVIFSKDRALQLEAVLRSFFARCSGTELVAMRVLYCCSNPRHKAQYEQLARQFPQVDFVSEVNFRDQLLGLLQHPLTLFLVDDNIFVNDFSMVDIVRALAQEPRALGFSLRLGQNTYYCYALNSAQKVPLFTPVNGINALQFDWTQSEYDFGYPLEVSSSVYRRGEIMALLGTQPFDHPNHLEGMMAGNARAFAAERPKLLCFNKSVTFCVPINKVQSVVPQNRAAEMFGCTAEALADQFELGRRIDIERLKGFMPVGCHQEIPLPFLM